MNNKELILTANKLVTSKSVQAEYSALLEHYTKENLYYEKVQILLALYNLNKNKTLLSDVADTYMQAKDYTQANKFYYLYLAKNNPKAASKFLNSLAEITNVNIEDYEYTPLSTEAGYLVDRYYVLINICSLCAKAYDKKTLSSILKDLNKMRKSLYSVINEIPEYIASYITYYENCLSGELTNFCNDSSINRFAIKLHPQNNTPYLNIINNYLLSGCYDEALKFYNKSYCKQFNQNQLNTKAEICWFISEKFVDYKDYEAALSYQKKALEFELQKDGE